MGNGKRKSYTKYEAHRTEKEYGLGGRVTSPLRRSLREREFHINSFSISTLQ